MTSNLQVIGFIASVTNFFIDFMYLMHGNISVCELVLVRNDNFFLLKSELHKKQANEWVFIVTQVFTEKKFGAYTSHELRYSVNTNLTLIISIHSKSYLVIGITSFHTSFNFVFLN